MSLELVDIREAAASTGAGLVHSSHGPQGPHGARAAIPPISEVAFEQARLSGRLRSAPLQPLQRPQPQPQPPPPQPSVAAAARPWRASHCGSYYFDDEFVPYDETRTLLAVPTGDGGARRVRFRGREYDSRFDSMRSAILMATIAIFCLLIVAISWIVWTLRSNLLQSTDEALPVVAELVNHTVGILRNADAASDSVRKATGAGERLTATALPDALTALNATTEIIHHLQHLASHPLLQLSLE